MSMELYRVGGCVRDRVMGRRSNDIDFAVEAESYAAMREGILAMGGKIFVENPEFLTIRARVGKETFDYVLCRRDGAYRDGRRPETVEMGTIFDDLARRDFTINAIAERADGSLIDPYNGMEDITRGIIRCVGDPFARFTEDGLRILRAVRFAVVFGFVIEAQTSEAMRSLRDNVTSVSIERIREETEKMFRVNGVASFRMLEEFGLTDLVFTDRLKLRLTPSLKG